MELKVDPSAGAFLQRQYGILLLLADKVASPTFLGCPQNEHSRLWGTYTTVREIKSPV